MFFKNKNKFVKGNLKDFGDTSGYFVGRFMGDRGRSDLETDEVEIAFKILPENFGDEKPHYHKGGVEINIVINGSYKVLINGEEVTLNEKDFLVVYPESKLKNLSAKKNTELIVVKAPSLPHDKYE